MPRVSIPDTVLKDLLAKAEPGVTLEAFLARKQVQQASSQSAFYEKRARSAKVSLWFLIGTSVISGFCFIADPDFEGLLVTLLLTGFSYGEYRTLQLFRQEDLRSHVWGKYNQWGFAATLFIYGAYHASIPETLPPSMAGVLDPSMISGIQSLTELFYWSIGILGGVSQSWYGWYYSQQPKP